MSKREIKYYVFIVALVGVYLFIILNYRDNHLFEVPFHNAIANVLALVSAVTFWMQLRRTENINEANYIMNLNNQFINNAELVKVEQKLMVYYEQVKQGIKPVKLDLDETIDAKDRQSLINYLVYLEGLAAIIQKGVMHLDVVDDLFAYRFFIAVNNPEVQRIELKKDKEFYQGCYALADAWTKKMQNQGWTIPMQETALQKTEEAEEIRKKRKKHWKNQIFF